MIQIVFGSLDTDHDLITGLYDIGCTALHTVFTYPVRLKFGTADLLFGEENVNAYYLEYDDERSGGFAPLAKNLAPYSSVAMAIPIAFFAIAIGE
mgnify:CR=1 FL=1